MKDLVRSAAVGMFLSRAPVRLISPVEGEVQMNQPSPAPGWYPDPSDPSRQIYWDGAVWVSPHGPFTARASNKGKDVAVTVGVCVLVAIGLMMSMQSISLMTGTGPIWTGVAVVGAGVAVAFLMRAPVWVRAVASLVLALSLLNVFYMENQLSEKRDEIGQVLGG